ncbi:hypothetical protein P8452_77109 [Trifolium repens]|jgi:hypothetical protein|nr:hypothetical protein P8452_77109 [Trifolium repens]
MEQHGVWQLLVFHKLIYRMLDLDWACGLGMADCKAIQKDGPCFQPDTLVSHASFAFNSFYQTNGNSDIACSFGGTATLTKHNPSKLTRL